MLTVCDCAQEIGSYKMMEVMEVMEVIRPFGAQCSVLSAPHLNTGPLSTEVK